jgi:hypothetical protein
LPPLFINIGDGLGGQAKVVAGFGISVADTTQTKMNIIYRKYTDKTWDLCSAKGRAPKVVNLMRKAFASAGL